jgi:hypothetical protein
MSRRLVPILSSLSLAVALAVLPVTPAAASSHLFPAQNEGACTAAGGTFEQVRSLKTCTVIKTEVETFDTREAGNSGKSWTVEIEVTTSTVYTSDGADDTTSDPTTTYGDSECYNPGGQLMTDEDLPPHCTP